MAVSGEEVGVSGVIVIYNTTLVKHQFAAKRRSAPCGKNAMPEA